MRPGDNKMVWRWDGADPFGVAVPDENPEGLGGFAPEEDGQDKQDGLGLGRQALP